MPSEVAIPRDWVLPEGAIPLAAGNYMTGYSNRISIPWAVQYVPGTRYVVLYVLHRDPVEFRVQFDADPRSYVRSIHPGGLRNWCALHECERLWIKHQRGEALCR